MNTYPAEDLIDIGMLCHAAVVSNFLLQVFGKVKFRIIFIGFILREHLII
jgi:hypothetical protein